MRRGFGLGACSSSHWVSPLRTSCGQFWLPKRVTTEQPATPVASVALGTAPGTDILHKSVAVLPFVDMSETKDQEYFGDGMAEEIINLLANVPDLQVPARTSSFYFKGKPDQGPPTSRASWASPTCWKAASGDRAINFG